MLIKFLSLVSRRDFEMKMLVHIVACMYILVCTQSFYILSVTANAVAIKTTETRKIQIGLERNGSLSDTNNIPKCRSDQKIHLVSYMYHQLQCRFSDDCSSVHEEPLLPDEVFHLHQMCSMHQQCRNLSFPLRSEVQRNRTNSIIIRYECIDRKSLINICEQTKRNLSDSVYLTSADIKEPFEKCECFIGHDNETFSISITDVRLNENMDNKCSPTTLFVSDDGLGNMDEKFRCDKTRNDYGAVFRKSPGEPLRSDVYIYLEQNSETILPEMVLVKLRPDKSLSLKCPGQKTTGVINTNRSTATTTVAPFTTTVLANNDGTKTQGPSTVLIIVFGVVTVISVVTVIIMALYVRRQRQLVHQEQQRHDLEMEYQQAMAQQEQQALLQEQQQQHEQEMRDIQDLRHQEQQRHDLEMEYQQAMAQQEQQELLQQQQQQHEQELREQREMRQQQQQELLQLQQELLQLQQELKQQQQHEQELRDQKEMRQQQQQQELLQLQQELQQQKQQHEQEMREINDTWSKRKQTSDAESESPRESDNLTQEGAGSVRSKDRTVAPIIKFYNSLAKKVEEEKKKENP